MKRSPRYAACAAASIIALGLLNAAAQAAHPALEACGGAAINTSEGVRERSVISHAMERRIEDFIRATDALPGGAVAIVKDDRIVYARGFGFAALETCEAATSQTRFYLKSTTKNFLGVAAAVLHEEGAIELDAPISEYLPDLALSGGVNAAQSSIRDHLTHTQPYFDSGLNFRTAFPGNLAEADFVSHVNDYSDAKDIRFRYSNFGPIMAAHAIGAKTGANWRDFIRETTFSPVGMNDSFTVMAEAEKGAMAQAYVGGFEAAFAPEPTKTDSQMHAAGGAVSTAADLARWLIVNLNHGMIDGEQALPRRAVEQAQARQVQLSAQFAEIARFAHGLGVYAGDYDGDVLMHHFGGETHLSFMPAHGLGVVILANELDNGVRVTHPLAFTIYDMLLGKDDLDARAEQRIAAIAEAKTSAAGRLEQYLAKVKAGAPDAPPSIAPDALAGAYDNGRLGAMTVTHDGEALRIAFGAMEGALEPLGGDLYLAHIAMWNTLPPQAITFREDDQTGFVLDWGGRIFTRRR